MRKLLFLLFVLAVTLQSGAQTFMVGDICYTVTSENEPYTVEVARNTKPTNNYIGEVTIPEKVDKDGKSYIVTGIGESAFSNCYMISSVIIPNTVKSIGNYAFTGCSGLRKLAIPNSVTSIGVAAFFNCNNLKNIVIPASVKTIGNGAFNNESCFFFCEAASKPMGWDLSSNSQWNNKKGTVLWSSFTEGEFGYQRTSGNTVSFAKVLGYKESLTIPSLVSHSGVSYMVTGICDNAFADNIDISEVVMPNTITSIGKLAFYGCTEIAAITIPKSVTTIGDNAFSGCTSLTSIVIPNSVTTIGNGVFSDCASLTSVSISNSVTTIGKNTFSNCISLISIVIPNSVTTISDNAFSGCTDLSQVTISNSVKSIGKSAFVGCAELKTVTIPNSVKSIDSYAFSGCVKLETVLIPKSVTTIGNNAFNSDKAVFYCECLGRQNGWSIDYTSGKYWNSGKGTLYWEISFIENGIAYFITSASTVSVRRHVGGATLKIPPVVKNNGTEYTVSDIGKYAFSGCLDITEVSIPKSVATIGEKAFSGCDNLKAIYCEVEGMPVGWAADCFPAPNVVTWGKDAFSDFMK